MGIGPSAEHINALDNRPSCRPRSKTVGTISPSHLAPRLSSPEVLTPFDLRQLMEAEIEKKQRSVQSTVPPSDDEEETLRGLHLLFGTDDGRSNASEDSGLGTPARLSLEELNWNQPAPQLQLETPTVPTPQTPTIHAQKLLELPSLKVPTRLHRKMRMQRQRSQSLQPNQQFYAGASVSSDEGIGSMCDSIRRLSVPLGRAKQCSQRRLSQMVSAIGEAIDQEIEQLGRGEKPASLFGSSVLNREWELVTVSEMCRRLSLDEIDNLELPIPEGASSSQILDELMIRQMMEILPPRAEGYPWVNIYNSEKHGFSLTTLYRKMAEFDEDLSPVLLIVRDTKDHVFGAVVSGAIRPSDHYSGTGDSCLLWRFTGVVPHTRDLRHYPWTGDNQFFVNAAKDALSIGAGGGHYGLWLDADLNHGRSQKCDTFNNEPLAGEKEDFIIQFIESYGFRM